VRKWQGVIFFFSFFFSLWRWRQWWLYPFDLKVAIQSSETFIPCSFLFQVYTFAVRRSPFAVRRSPCTVWRSDVSRFRLEWNDIRLWYCKKLQFSVYLLRKERKRRKQFSCSSKRSEIFFIPTRCQWGRYTIFLSIVMNLLFQIVWDSISVLLWRFLANDE